MRSALEKKVLICCTLFGLLVMQSFATVIYDGAAGTLPQSQNWQLQGAPLPADYSCSWQNGAALLRSGTEEVSVESSAVFYTDAVMNPNVGVLDRLAGYNVSFKLKIDEEHNNGYWAGYAVGVIGNDQYGVELAFRESKIFAYGTSEEEVAIDTKVWNTYTLNIQGGQYDLLCGNTQILSGMLRDFSFYNITNGMFFGDDGGTVWSTSELAYVTVVPEPVTLLLFGLGGLVLQRRKK